MSPRILALVLIRVVGTLALFIGLLELVMLPVAFVLGAGVLKSYETFADPWVLRFATSGGFYAIAGGLCLAFSRRLARLASKYCDTENSE